MLSGYRICNTSYSATAFSGVGAELYGGRWNKVGTKMVYVAGSRSLATLELLVHIEDRTLIDGAYSMAEVKFDSSLVKILKPSELPDGWDSQETGIVTQEYGSNWVESEDSAILQVPSVVTPGEVNFLINLKHPDFKLIEIGEMLPFPIDRRLI